MVRTVLGDISPEMITHAQCHEHLFISKGRSFEIHPALWMDDRGLTEQELESYFANGGNLIVDAQPYDCGRMALSLAEASRHTKIHIVAVTGFHKTVFCRENSPVLNFSCERLAEIFSEEFLSGMTDENGIRLSAKAGLVKAAVDKNGVYADSRYETLFHAAAEAAKNTGAPILVHVENDADAFEILDFFGGYGIPANRIILCHLDRAKYDIGYHKEILSTGCYLNYDSINRLKYVSHKQELDLIFSVIEAGYEDQIMLSLDTTRERLSAYGSSMSLSYILTDFIPMMKNEGITDEAIKKMTAENAKKALNIEKGENHNAKS